MADRVRRAGALAGEAVLRQRDVPAGGEEFELRGLAREFTGGASDRV